MMRIIVAIGLTGLLSACATCPVPEPRIVVQYVDVPTAISCVPTALTPPPAYVDSDEALKAALDGGERYRLTLAGRRMRNARLAELEPVIGACRTPIPDAPKPADSMARP